MAVNWPQALSLYLFVCFHLHRKLVHDIAPDLPLHVNHPLVPPHKLRLTSHLLLTHFHCPKFLSLYHTSLVVQRT